jgi:beta-N-acetylhexosaminidase
VAVAAFLAIVAVVAVAVAIASSGSSPAPPPIGGPAPSSVLGQGAAGDPSVPAPNVDAAAFRPSRAAVSLAAGLPLSDQVAQLFLIGVDGISTGSPDVAAFSSLDWGGAAFGRANFIGDSQIAALAGGIAALAKSAGHVPPLIAAPQEGGLNTAFPDLPPEAQPLVAASGDPAAARAQAMLAGKALLALGVNMTFAPLADVDVLNGALSGRLFSSNPAVVARFAANAVRGYSSVGMISAVGHFPGAGAASADPDLMTASVGGSLGALEQRDLIPFAAVAATAPVVMM